MVRIPASEVRGGKTPLDIARRVFAEVAKVIKKFVEQRKRSVRG
jgi:hypothetical protein